MCTHHTAGSSSQAFHCVTQTVWHPVGFWYLMITLLDVRAKSPMHGTDTHIHVSFAPMTLTSPWCLLANVTGHIFHGKDTGWMYFRKVKSCDAQQCKVWNRKEGCKWLLLWILGVEDQDKDEDTNDCGDYSCNADEHGDLALDAGGLPVNSGWVTGGQGKTHCYAAWNTHTEQKVSDHTFR